LSTAIDLFSRRLLGYATSAHPDAELAGETIKMAVAARGGKAQVAEVIFHSDRGSRSGLSTSPWICLTIFVRRYWRRSA
jgi:transposase InsO family protein